MTIYFMGGEMGAFIPSDSTVIEAATSGNFNTSFARCAIYAPYTPNYFESPSIGSLTTAWIHFDFGTGSDNYIGDGTRFSWYDGSATERIRFVANNNGTVSMMYNVGAGWVTAGSSITTTFSGTRQTIDIAVVCNSASGSIKLYLSGTKRIDSGTIDLSAITALNKIRFSGFTNVVPLGTITMVSQVIVADESTIGMRLLTRYMNGAGASTDWTGAYTDIDEIVYEDADFILSGSNNQVSTFTQTGPAITGYTVRAVGVTARAKCGASGPQHLQLALRVSGTNYFSSSLALDAGYGAFVNIWETNPATSAAWVNTAIDTIQPGVKSIA